jgi:hypothetical protein
MLSELAGDGYDGRVYPYGTCVCVCVLARGLRLLVYAALSY